MAQITIDFSPAGFGKGLKNAVKVIGYHLVGDFVIVAGLYLDKVSVTTHTAQQGVILAFGIMMVNAALKLVKDWLTTVQPSIDPIVETTTPSLSFEENQVAGQLA